MKKFYLRLTRFLGWCITNNANWGIHLKDKLVNLHIHHIYLYTYVSTWVLFFTKFRATVSQSKKMRKLRSNLVSSFIAKVILHVKCTSALIKASWNRDAHILIFMKIYMTFGTHTQIIYLLKIFTCETWTCETCDSWEKMLSRILFFGYVTKHKFQWP